MTEDERDSWQRIGSATASDAMETLALRRAVIHGFRCVLPGRTIVGPACTIRQLPKHGADEKGARLVRHAEVAAELARPGQVIVLDVGGATNIGSWGEIHSRRSHRRGIAGLVVNGAVRDVGRIRALGFPVACLGYSPIKSQWDLETAAVDEPIAIAGVQIRPGDLIVGDEDGIVVIPQARTTEVLAVARAIMEQEEATV